MRRNKGNAKWYTPSVSHHLNAAYAEFIKPAGIIRKYLHLIKVEKMKTWKHRTFRTLSTHTVIGIFAIVTLVIMFNACENPIMIKLLEPFGVPEKGSKGNGGSHTFTSIPDFETWLKAQPNNNASNPHTAKLNVSILGGGTSADIGQVLRNYRTKYVSLDFSGSTFPRIEDWAFWDCTSLISITIPNSVISFGLSAFHGCGLTSITIPNSVTRIGVDAFAYCTSLTSVIIPDSVIIIGDNAFHKSSITGVTIGNSVTSIGGGAFSICTGLASVTIGNKVESIGNGAFHGCTSLTVVTIPDSVTRIGNDAFEDCTSLTSVTIGNKVESIGDYAFHGCGLTSITIPNNVTRIGDDAFAGCTGLTSVTIGNKVESIGKSAFNGCVSITGVIIPNSVIIIEDDSFAACTSLTSVTIGNKVESIGFSAFNGDTRLTSVTIPASVTRIGDYAFAACTGITSVTFATGSIIASANFGTWAFPGASGGSVAGNDLRTAYLANDAGRYTRSNGTWTRE
jgi:hypothetical protein